MDSLLNIIYGISDCFHHGNSKGVAILYHQNQEHGQKRLGKLQQWLWEVVKPLKAKEDNPQPEMLRYYRYIRADKDIN